MGQYIIGGLIGAAFGYAMANISAIVTRRNAKKDDANALMAASMLRTLIDMITLLVVFLVRKVMPFPFYAVIIGTALGLSVSNVLFATRIGKKMKSEQEKQKIDENEVK